MARVQDAVIVIKVSRLLKDSEYNEAFDIINEEIIQSLEAVVQELVGKDTLVEIEA